MRVSLSVTANPQGESESIVDGVYRVPAGHVLQFDGVLESGTEYLIQTNIPTTEREDQLTVGVETCGQADPAQERAGGCAPPPTTSGSSRTAATRRTRAART